MTSFNTVWFPLLYDCNNRCSWCYAPSQQTASKEKRFDDKKEQEFLELVSDLEVKKIILIGGEPSTYPHLERIIKRINTKNIAVSMVTNGRKLSKIDFTKRLRDIGLRSITVSIEGSKPQVHDAITNIHGSFYETLRGIENSVSTGFPTSTETTMCRENNYDLENIVDLLEGKGLSNRLFNICGPCVSDLENSSFSLSPTQGAKMFQRVYDRAREKNIRLVTPVPICAFDKDKYNEMVKNKSISHGCHILFGFNFVLDPNGDVLPCVHFSDFPIFNIYGNGEIMSAERFLETYNDANRTNQKFRRELRRYPSQHCQDDGCWNPCTGGCSVFWLKYDPAKEIKGLKEN